MTDLMISSVDGGGTGARDGSHREAPFSSTTSNQRPPFMTTAMARDDGASTLTRQRDEEAWWSIHPFRGMINDIRRRAPYYVSDWLDAWDYRVVPATVFMFFAKYVMDGLSLFMAASDDDRTIANPCC